MQGVEQVIAAYEAITDPKASLLSKAHGYLVLIRELLNVRITEHKNVSLSPLQTDKIFLQSLCTRLSKEFKEQSCGKCSNEEQNSGDNDNGEADSESQSESAKSEICERFEQSGKDIPEFVEELKEELRESADISEQIVEAGQEEKGGGATVRSTSKPIRSTRLESLLLRYQSVIQIDGKKDYKKFLPKVWVNPVVPYTFKAQEEVRKPLVVFCANGAGYNHEDMISGLKALPVIFADIFEADYNCLYGQGMYNKTQKIDFREIQHIPKTVLVFTNGCDSSRRMSKFCEELVDKGHIVEVFTMFDNSNCGCPTFHYLNKANIPLHRNMKF